MIKDIMSKSFVLFSSEDKVEKLFNLITKGIHAEYVIVEFPGQNFCALNSATSKEVLKKSGEKIGREVVRLRLASIPEFRGTFHYVNIDESELVAKGKATRSPEKQIVVLEDDKPVGIVKAQVRTALFGGIPATLYGERFDVFEKGNVKPKYKLICPECNSTFDFYKPKIEGDKVFYCCPKCRCVIED